MRRFSRATMFSALAEAAGQTSGSHTHMNAPRAAADGRLQGSAKLDPSCRLKTTTILEECACPFFLSLKQRGELGKKRVPVNRRPIGRQSWRRKKFDLIRSSLAVVSSGVWRINRTDRETDDGRKLNGRCPVLGILPDKEVTDERPLLRRV